MYCSNMTSADLIWLLVKKNNRYLVKRNGNSNASITFSSEPNNLYNLNSFKYSGTYSSFLLVGRALLESPKRL